MKVPHRALNGFVSWVLVVLYADFIYDLSAMERMPFALEAKFHTDKLVHGVEYAILGLLLARALRLSTRASDRKVVWASLILGALYALTDELHQGRVPHRQASAGDWLADSIGVLCGAKLWIEGFLRPKRTGLKRKNA